MICEKCGSETESITCGHCGGVIKKLGPFCYLCGQKSTESEAKKIISQEEGDTLDFAERVLCSDGACIGVIGEDGLCKECGKPYTPES
jgi:hypothetical protein